MRSVERETTSSRLVDTFAGIPGVVSATLVGSFPVVADVRAASDIDVVVVCERLRRQVFDACIAAGERLTGADLGRPGCVVRINSTFGPLKFDDPDVVVLHLMVYDIAGHRDHVLASPFTCYDWERSPVVAGRRLSELYPVLRLQPRDFTAARRGLADYAEDLARGSISYRRYDWSGDSPAQVIEHAPQDPRHAGEYAYHIIRNVLRNYAKLLAGANVTLTDEELESFWTRHLPSSAALIPEYRSLRAQKESGARRFGPSSAELARQFISGFAADLDACWGGNARRVHWVRHARTSLNDGTFLGQGRDPEPTDAHPGGWPALTPVKLYASPSKRSMMTAGRVGPGIDIVPDERLLEQNYGSAEGMTFESFGEAYPGIVDAWRRREDPAFPGGESAADVRGRLGSFVRDLTGAPEGASVVVTHNVVLRELLGELLHVPPADRHRIPIAHLDPYETIVHDGKLYPQLSVSQKAAITDALVKS